MAASSEQVELRGDEEDLFRAFDSDLQRRVARLVVTSHANVEEACSFAWEQLIRSQPERDRNWRAWLTTVAVREAWRLHARERRMPLRLGTRDHGDGFEPLDPRDAYAEKLELSDAVALLAQLPPRLQRIAALRGFGLKYADISAITGDSPNRISQLVFRANARMAELRNDRRLDAGVPPRVRRLTELTQDPPPWLTQAIGRCPGRKQAASRVLAWRRAALAISDYRQLNRVDDPASALGDRPEDPSSRVAYDRAQNAITRLRQPERERGLER